MKTYEVEFANRLAYDNWITSKKDSIVILSQSDFLNEFGYEASARLERPKIKVTYIDFLED